MGVGLPFVSACTAGPPQFSVRACRDRERISLSVTGSVEFFDELGVANGERAPAWDRRPGQWRLPLSVDYIDAAEVVEFDPSQGVLTELDAHLGRAGRHVPAQLEGLAVSLERPPVRADQVAAAQEAKPAAAQMALDAILIWISWKLAKRGEVRRPVLEHRDPG